MNDFNRKKVTLQNTHLGAELFFLLILLMMMTERVSDDTRRFVEHECVPLQNVDERQGCLTIGVVQVNGVAVRINGLFYFVQVTTAVAVLEPNVQVNEKLLDLSEQQMIEAFGVRVILLGVVGVGEE